MTDIQPIVLLLDNKHEESAGFINTLNPLVSQYMPLQSASTSQTKRVVVSVAL